MQSTERLSTLIKSNQIKPYCIPQPSNPWFPSFQSSFQPIHYKNMFNAASRFGISVSFKQPLASIVNVDNKEFFTCVYIFIPRIHINIITYLLYLLTSIL